MANSYLPPPSEPKDDELIEDQPPGSIDEYSTYPSRLLAQVVISGIILILMFGITQTHHHWAQWTRQHLRCAIDATTIETFGAVTRAAFFKGMIKNVSNLVRLEEITKQISQTPSETLNQAVLQNWSWPLKGNITKRFGWETEVSGNVKRFYPGIEITAPANFTVNAVAAGRINEIRQEKNGGWLVGIEHGQGWKSAYHNLDQIQVKVGQYVKTGEVLARLARRDQNGDSKMSFELKKDEQPVDPLTVLVNY